jgi:hypothetical protein
VPPPVARECTVEEIDLLIRGIDKLNKEAEQASRRR